MRTAINQQNEWPDMFDLSGSGDDIMVFWFFAWY